MKLGIAVIYLVSEKNESLFDLHLKQIEKHTQVPYTIYGSANRLLPGFRQRLKQHPRVKICDCPTTDLRGAAEHSYYLEQLVKMAIEDGASHVVTLHVDSFPIRSGWAEELADKLSDSCVFATLDSYERINTACLFFQRDFYLNYHPKFLLSESESARPECEQFFRLMNIYKSHSGNGYGFKAYSEGLTWYYLLDSTNSEVYDAHGRIYDDMIFHLIGAVRIGDDIGVVRNGDKHYVKQSVLTTSHFVLSLKRVTKIVKQFIPKSMRKILLLTSSPMEPILDKLINRPKTAHEFKHDRAQLLENPESYLNNLRTTKR